MQTVAPILTFANDQEPPDLTEIMPPVGADLTLVVVLVAVALVLGRALLAVLAAAAALLVPALALFRYLIVVVGLIVLLGLGMTDGGEQPAPEEPTDTGPTPTLVNPGSSTRPPARKPAPTLAPTARSSLAAPGG
jgi:hypothetical protein